MKFPYSFFTLLMACLASSAAIAQQNLPQDQLQFFEKNIRPVLVKYCYECHSIDSGKTRGGLLVDTREGLLLGGDSGPAIVAKNLEESVLWSAINWEDYEMPPEEKMPAEVIANFKTWIEMGAPDPRLREKLIVESKVDIEAGKQHWSFQKPSRPKHDNIDAFVAEKLRTAGVKSTSLADPLTLLRRLNFDLVGLPPTPEEARAFYPAWKKDPQAAIAKKVDELLNRPQFGERWGRYWLDVARYAESSGKDANFTFPHAWRYRDYVIDAFNADKPYDEFVQEQLAGDLLPSKTDEQWQERLIATGFLALGAKGLNERNPRQFRMDLVDEQIDTMSQAFLGITVACARCHDHKFDPIPQIDYYALAGIFLSTETYYGTVFGLQNHRSSDLLLLPVLDKKHQTQTYTPKQVADMKRALDDTYAEIRSKRIEAQRNNQDTIQREMVALRNRIGRLEGLLSTLGEDGIPKTYGMGVQDAKEVVNASVLVRGDVEKPAQKVDRGFLQVLADAGKADLRRDKSGRRELAQWITSANNPLTARVMVNRIWMHLLGDAIVRSPNNWGVTGQRPTHPELLDYLALRFVENGWSIKSMIREIVLSKTYQRGSQFIEKSFEADPDNNLLWRVNPRPLDAEALRDAMLAIGGNLQRERPYGSAVARVGDKRVNREIEQGNLTLDGDYRSVYLPILRSDLPEFLELFDFADPSATSPERAATNTPSQALYLLNNPFVLQQAEGMAKRLIKTHSSTTQRVWWAFVTAYGRSPTKAELQSAAAFFQRFRPTSTAPRNQQARPLRRPGGMRPGGMRPGPGGGRRVPKAPAIVLAPLTPEEQTMAAFCQSLLISAEFRVLN